MTSRKTELIGREEELELAERFLDVVVDGACACVIAVAHLKRAEDPELQSSLEGDRATADAFTERLPAGARVPA